MRVNVKIPVLFFIMLSVMSGSSHAIDVYSNGSGDAPTIAAAIAMATDGQTIRIFDGVYHEENLLVDGKNITFQYGGNIPIIEAPISGSGTGLTVRNVTNLTIFGLHFKGFEKGLVIENGVVSVWSSYLTECATAAEISGSLSDPYFVLTLIDSCGTGFDVTGGTEIRIANVTIVNCSTGVKFSGGTTLFEKSIVYRCDTGAYYLGGSVALQCNDFWENAVDYSGCSPGPTDFSALPRFCYEADGSPGLYYLHIDSPCWSYNNDCGVNVGAFTSVAGCTGTAVKRSTWGEIKALYR